MTLSLISNDRNKNLVAIFLLVAATLAAYLLVLDNQFVTYDDPFYVTENKAVLAGLNWNSIIWAFTTSHGGNWYPLTWLSHMLDVTIYGLAPRGHHLTNLLFHIANTLLLFTFLRQITTAYWRSLIVALLFALHPLHVESVAWISERKDLLSTFFLFLTLHSYRRYALCPGPTSYLVTLLLAACGLMAKPMLVSLPFILLLLDWWPLKRLPTASFPNESKPSTSLRSIIIEKLPFFAMALLIGIIALVTQDRVGAIAPLTVTAILGNAGRAIVVSVSYIVKMFLPINLAVFYPFNPEFSQPAVFIPSLIFFVTMTTAALIWRRRFPFFTFGWLWYLVTLLPVSGIIRIGNMALADRYTYIPLIGPFLVIVWGAAAATLNRTKIQAALAGVTLIILIFLGAATFKQTRHWFNGITLFSHASIVVKDNWLAFENLGVSYMLQADTGNTSNIFHSMLKPIPPSHQTTTDLVNNPPLESAIKAFLELIRIWPDSDSARYNLGLAYYMMGNREAALNELNILSKLNSDSAKDLERKFMLFQNSLPVR